jgi:hypothetical protein
LYTLSVKPILHPFFMSLETSTVTPT